MKKNYSILSKAASVLLALGMTFCFTSCGDSLGESDNPSPVVQEVIETIAEVTGASPEAVTAALQSLVTDEAVAAAAAKGEPIKVVVSTDAGIASEAADKTITIPQKNGANIEITFDAVPTGTDMDKELEFKAEGVADDAASGDSQSQLVISMPTTSSATPSISIDMPTTTVTLKSSGSTVYKSVTSKTAKQTLILDEGVTIEDRFMIKGGSVDATKGHILGNIYLAKENMGEIHLAMNPEDRPEWLNFWEKGNTLVFDTDLPKVGALYNATSDKKPEDATIAFNTNKADLRWFGALQNFTVAVYNDGETTPGKATLKNVSSIAKNTIFEPNQIEFRYPGNEWEDNGKLNNKGNGISVPDRTVGYESSFPTNCTFNGAELSGAAEDKNPYVKVSIPGLGSSFKYTFENWVIKDPADSFEFSWVFAEPSEAYSSEFVVTLVFKDCKFGDADFAIDSAFFNWIKANEHAEIAKNVTYKIQIVNGETTKTYKFAEDSETINVYKFVEEVE